MLRDFLRKLKPMTPTGTSKLRQQIEFLIEIDKLKSVFRQSFLADSSRKENDAEHSWQLALAAVVLEEHAATPIDLLRVIKMVLIHDLVEIDAGDVIVYDRAARAAQADKERAAADRIYSMLPTAQGGELRKMWEEFEARQTPEAKFAAALDRLLPILLNIQSGGKTWQANGITADRVLEHNAHIAQGSPAIWELVQGLIAHAVQEGYLPKA